MGRGGAAHLARPGIADGTLRAAPRVLQPAQVLAAEGAAQDHEPVPEEAALLGLQRLEGEVVAGERRAVPARLLEHAEQVG